MSVPDWYPDPSNPSRLRYWDGSAWTADVNSATPNAIPGIPAQFASTAPRIEGVASSPARVIVVQPRTNGLAVASLVLGLVPVIPLIGSLLAILFGMMAERQINESEGAQRGRGMAIAGAVLGTLELVVVGGIVLVLWLHQSTPSSIGVLR